MKIRFFTLLVALLLSSFAGAQTYDTNTLTNGLVAWYPFHNDAKDYSGMGNDLILQGSELGSDRFGAVNHALNVSFNKGACSANKVGISGNSDRTISLWFYLNDQPGYSEGNLLEWGSLDGPVRDMSLYYFPNRLSEGYNFMLDGYYYCYLCRHDDGVAISTWHNIIAVYSQNFDNSKIYIDGKLELIGWGSGLSWYRYSTDTTDTQIQISGSTNTPQNGGQKYGGINGKIDDIRIYNRALSSNEVAALYAMESTPPVPPTTTDTFGSGTNQFGIDFVTVGNPGNSNDTTGYGGVPYSYRIGKYTISQNQVDAATRNGLQNVTAGAWSGDQPAANISWYEAAAYVNWLNTSQGYRPAYNLTFTNGAWSMALWPISPDTNGNVAWTLGGTNLFRNARCHYFLPSENEWYKAAYYDPNKNGGSGGYWLYPTGSDTAPTPVASGTAAATAVYNQPWETGPASVFQAGGLSDYGTMGQIGNVWQWEENAYTGYNIDPSAIRGIRSGIWHAASYLSALNREGYGEANNGYSNVGFRIASVDDSWLNNGLVAYYPFNGNANDAGSNFYNGSVYGAKLITDRNGILKGAYSFNGSGDYIDLGNRTGFNFGYGDFTLSSWVKPVSNPPDNQGYFISKYAAPSPGYDPNPSNPRTFGYGIAVGTDNLSYAYLSESQAVYGYSTLNDGRWHHVVADYNRSNNLNVYVDGNRIASGSISAASILNQSNSLPLILGKLSEGSYWGPQYYCGCIDDVRIYNRALSSNEVAQLYALENTPPPVLPPPTIATQPYDRSISLGQTTSFTIGATGSGPFTYQWMKDGVALANQTNASLVITNAQSNAVGYYSCTVTDANSNAITSSNAALNISGVPFWLWQGLVAYYPLNGNANDSGIHKYDGVIYYVTPCSNRFEITEGAYYFNGLNAYIDLGSRDEFNFGYNDFTVTSWVKLDNDCENGYILSKYNLNNASSYGFGTSGYNTSYAFFWGDHECQAVRGSLNIQNDSWHQVIASYNRSNLLSIYIDGKVDASVNISSENQFQSNNIPLLLGKFAGASGVRSDWLKGCISDVRIYNRALSSNEVASLYALESTPPGPTNSQSITFPAIPTQTLTNGACTLGATADSGLPVTYTIGDTNVATLTNGTLIPLGVGTSTVVASQAGDTNYLPATPVTNTLVVTLAQQSVTPIAVATRTYGSLPFGLTLPTNASGLPITARIVSGPATLSGTNLILTGTGTVTLAYDAPGSSVYAAASVTNSFVVTNGLTNLKSQSIITKPLGSKTYGSAPFALMGVASSKLPLTYWSSNTNVVVINGTNAVITGAGQAVITAYQPGDGTTYNPATPVSQPLLVNQAAQKLTLKAPKSTAYGSAPVAISATSSAGLPVTLTSSDPTIATVTNSGTNSLLVPTGVGTITLTASQAGNVNVVIAPSVGQPVVITPGAQTITFAPLATNRYGTAPITLTATSSAGLPMTFTSSATNVAAISGNTLTITGAGSAKITASQPGSKLWAPAKAITQSLTVTKASQAITLSLPSTMRFTNGGPLPLTGTASSGLPVTYMSGNPKILFIQGTNSLIAGRGTTTVVATQPGNANYLPATPVTNTVTVQ